MIKVKFFINLRNDTVTNDFIKGIKPSGYLIAPNNATKKLLEQFSSIEGSRKKIGLMVDNGNFAFIKKIAKEFLNAANETNIRLKDSLGENHQFKDSPPQDVRKSINAIANNLQEKCYIEIGNGDNLEEQIKLRPTSIIGVEDITIATIISLNFKTRYTGFSINEISKMNLVVAENANIIMQLLPDSLANNYYPVASAMSYDTAFEAGKIFAAQKLKNVSMGYGAFMADDSYTNSYYVSGKAIQLEANFPNRYIRTILVSIGFINGYKSVNNSVPESFHFLGLGAPIMIALVAFASQEIGTLSFDAVSPIKDAAEGTLYLYEPSFLKSRTRRLSLHIVSGKLKKWNCKCPFCKKFTSEYPFDYIFAKTWYKKNKVNEIKSEHLVEGGSLYSALPLFSEPKAKNELRKIINYTRMAHNHWVLNRIMNDINLASKTKDKFEQFVHRVVSDYQKHTNSSHFSDAIKFCLSLILK